jgi:argininosuccinate lyase
MIPSIVPLRERMLASAKEGFSTATDLADYLVRKGLAFRDAHEVVGKAVKYCIDHQLMLDQMPLEAFHTFSTLIEEDVYTYLTVEGSVKSRNHIGGTAPDQVRFQTALASKLILQRLKEIRDL